MKRFCGFCGNKTAAEERKYIEVNSTVFGRLKTQKPVMVLGDEHLEAAKEAGLLDTSKGLGKLVEFNENESRKIIKDVGGYSKLRRLVDRIELKAERKNVAGSYEALVLVPVSKKGDKENDGLIKKFSPQNTWSTPNNRPLNISEGKPVYIGKKGIQNPQEDDIIEAIPYIVSQEPSEPQPGQEDTTNQPAQPGQEQQGPIYIKSSIKRKRLTQKRVRLTKRK